MGIKTSLFSWWVGEAASGGLHNYYAMRRSLRDWWRTKEYWYSDSRLLEFQDSHGDEVCVVVGNGPSLNETDTSLLADGVCSFGMNRIYIGLDTLGFSPTFYVSVNKLVIEQCWDDIKQLPMPKFLSSHCGVRPHRETDAIFLRTQGVKSCGPAFSRDLVAGLWEGATVTYVALQLAFWMGFRKVILIGVDHNFTTKGAPNKEVVSEGDDPNHFAGGYFGKGFRWQLPDLEVSEMAYRMADYTFRLAGREIVDCTVGGKCPVFRKGDLAEELVSSPPPTA